VGQAPNSTTLVLNSIEEHQSRLQYMSSSLMSVSILGSILLICLARVTPCSHNMGNAC